MKRPNHKLHIFLSVITSGAWLVVYLPIYFMSRKNPESAAHIDARDLEKSKFEEERKAKRAESLATYSRPGPKNLGYTKARGGQMYVLACTHQIRAKKTVHILSQGMLNKNVWCEICNDERQVTAMPYWVQ
jgi:hypothetical protein